MTYNVSSLQTQVQTRLDDTGFSTATILQFLNDAQRDFTNNKFARIMEASQNYTLASGISDLTNGVGLPALFQTAIDLRCTTVGSESVLFYMDPKEFDLAYPQPSLVGNNLPYIYYKFGSTINVFPAPDRAYTMTLRYYKSPVELTTGTDVPEISSEWQELLVLGALKRCHELNDNYDMAAIVQGKIDEMTNSYVTRMSLGKSQPSIMKLNGYSPGRR